MKKVLLSIALLASVPLMSQAQEVKNANQLAMEEQAKKGYFGHFTHLLEEKYQITVNYSFTPKVPTSEVNFMLHTPEARPLSISVKDKTGKVVLNWEPQQENYLLEGKLDVSKLKKGSYTYVIMWDKASAYEIDFEKN